MVALVGQNGQAVVMGKREKDGAHLFQNTPSGTQLATEPRETTRAGGKTDQDWEVAPPAVHSRTTRIVDSSPSEPPCHGRGFSDRIETHFHGRPFRCLAPLPACLNCPGGQCAVSRQPQL